MNASLKFKFNRIIFFDGCKMFLGPRHTQIDHNCVDWFSIWRSVFQSVIFFSLLLFWNETESSRVCVCVIKLKWLFNTRKWMFIGLVGALYTVYTRTHWCMGTAKCCKYTHLSRIIKSFGSIWLHFFISSFP